MKSKEEDFVGETFFSIREIKNTNRIGLKRFYATVNQAAHQKRILTKKKNIFAGVIIGFLIILGIGTAIAFHNNTYIINPIDSPTIDIHICEEYPAMIMNDFYDLNDKASFIVLAETESEVPSKINQSIAMRVVDSYKGDLTGHFNLSIPNTKYVFQSNCQYLLFLTLDHSMEQTIAQAHQTKDYQTIGEMTGVIEIKSDSLTINIFSSSIYDEALVEWLDSYVVK